MLCLEHVKVSLRDSEVLELNEGIAGDSGGEKRGKVLTMSLSHNIVTHNHKRKLDFIFNVSLVIGKETL
jgi:hypothetical protein